jgi:c-di-GMP-binding flagellar brake protein YcgR
VSGVVEGPMTERRYHRFRLKVPIYISMEGSLFRKKIYLESKDVSGGGFAFETGREIPLDATSRVVVGQIGDLGEPALIHGRVVHREKVPGTERYAVGVEFTEFVNVTREEILSRIDRWKEEAEPASV